MGTFEMPPVRPAWADSSLGAAESERSTPAAAEFLASLIIAGYASAPAGDEREGRSAILSRIPVRLVEFACVAQYLSAMDVRGGGIESGALVESPVFQSWLQIVGLLK